ncbi:hypothetical protein ERT44_11585 [Stenotrophomonas sp. MA5]|jgi:murein DD-endopeptidase MepM/ murein hydrolase activator NlpD|uniref:peptidoglycan DD-metalloendopeptidase family protein n=1 Tax=Stenotrophomonas sp. MA5 TaxID=2508572 RepID=UPI001009DD8D|nr:peptidoglycan DD-metalloendopeptidase family protein [Stenotrophomonas sp. MA5]RXK66035.1 hypothetical protein ERT44_11585 [Stenotrophomonas sp. MA5]
MNGYGNTIAIEHMIRGQVVHTMYAHRSAASPLKVKDKVKKGDPLGPVGESTPAVRALLVEILESKK